MESFTLKQKLTNSALRTYLTCASKKILKLKYFRVKKHPFRHMVQHMGPQTMRAAVVGQNVPLSFLRGHSQERRDQLSVIFRVHGDCEFHKFPGPAHRIPLRPERVVNINQLMLQLPSCEGKTLLVAQIATYQMDEFTVTLRNSTWRNFHGWAQTAPSPLPDSKDTAPRSPLGHQKDSWTRFPASPKDWTSTQDALGTLAMPGYIVIDLPHRYFSPSVKVYRKVIHLFTVTYYIIIFMMFLIALLLILLLLRCYLFCNKQYPYLRVLCGSEVSLPGLTWWKNFVCLFVFWSLGFSTKKRKN